MQKSLLFELDIHLTRYRELEAEDLLDSEFAKAILRRIREIGELLND